MPDRGHGYDYGHATSNTQFIALVVIITVLGTIGVLGGLALALFGFGLLT